MHAFKHFLKMFITGPLLVIACFALLGTLIGGEYLYAVGIVLSLIAYFAFWGWVDQRDTRKLREAVEARGLNPDYFVHYLDGGVAIDLAGEKVLVGNLKAGKIFSFADIKTVESENAPYHDKVKYNIYLNTHNFDTPRVGVGFAGDKAMRDAAYAKLNAALKFS